MKVCEYLYKQNYIVVEYSKRNRSYTATCKYGKKFFNDYDANEKNLTYVKGVIEEYYNISSGETFKL